MTPETITLVDAAGTCRARVLPERGFNCYSFEVGPPGKSVEVLWADPEFATGTKRPTRSGIPILFPFAGRIGGTTFQYRGREYQLEPGDDFGNAIHGFVVHRAWRVVERAADRVVGEFQASRDDRALLDRWPADFRIRVEYRLTSGTLRANITVDNPDVLQLPCGLGLHGYYRVPLGPTRDASQCRVRVPVADRWQLAQLLPTGQRVAFDAAQQLSAGMAFGEMHLDDVFDGLTFADGACHTAVIDPQNGRTMTMRFDEQFPRCVVFTPPHREAICIEPYTTVPDAFALAARGIDAGLLTIEPGGSWHTWFEIRLDEIAR